MIDLVAFLMHASFCFCVCAAFLLSPPLYFTQATSIQLMSLLAGVPHETALLVDCGEHALDGGQALRRWEWGGMRGKGAWKMGSNGKQVLRRWTQSKQKGTGVNSQRGGRAA